MLHAFFDIRWHFVHWFFHLFLVMFSRWNSKCLSIWEMAVFAELLKHKPYTQIWHLMFSCYIALLMLHCWWCCWTTNSLKQSQMLHLSAAHTFHTCFIFPKRQNILEIKFSIRVVAIGFVSHNNFFWYPFSWFFVFLCTKNSPVWIKDS